MLLTLALVIILIVLYYKFYGNKEGDMFLTMSKLEVNFKGLKTFYIMLWNSTNIL